MMKNEDKIRYNDVDSKITMIDQRNMSSNKSRFFLDRISRRLVKFNVAAANQDELKYQV